MKQISEAALIGGRAAVIGQKHIAHEHDAGVANQGVEVTALDFLCQTQVLLDHLEEDLDIPALTVDADNFLVGQIGIRGQDGQPVAVFPVANEYQLAKCPAGERDQCTGQDLCSAPALFQPAIDRHQIQTLALKTIMDRADLFHHPNNRHRNGQCGYRSGHGEPTVHEQIACGQARLQCPVDHRFQMLCRLHGGFAATLMGAAATIHRLEILAKTFLSIR